MIELPDDELDKLFRKSSEELDPQFDPEDWNNLKKRLDQQDGRTAGAWIRKWWPLGLLLLLIPGGIASYFWLSGSNGDEARNTKPATEAAVSKSNDKEIAEGNEEENDDQNTVNAAPEIAADANKADATNEEVGLEENKKVENAATATVSEEAKTAVNRKTAQTGLSRNKNHKISKTLPRSQSKAGGVYLEPNRSKTEGGDGALILNDSKKLISDSKGTSASELGARQAIGPNGVEKRKELSVIKSGQSNAPATTESQTVETIADNAQQRTSIIVAMLSNQPLFWGNGIPYPAITSPEITIAPQTPEKGEKLPVPKWAYRFGYSPDLSTVGLKDFVKPGAAVSLLAEYNLVSRLYVQSGAIWSRKAYFGYGDSYELPKNPHYYGPDVKSVDGVCQVLEIPVNLRFDLMRGERSIIFVSSGVSSYHMLKEKYHYAYENENDPKIVNRGWHGKTGWYWLSHLNASVGYEYKISPKLSLLAEPYLRIPLKRVGYGKVNLFTTGAWISVRYTPKFR